MPICLNCHKRTSLRNPEYYLNENSRDVICQACYDLLPDLKINMAMMSREDFAQAEKAILEGMQTHQFSAEAQSYIEAYLFQEKTKLQHKLQETTLNDHLVTTGYQFEGYHIKEYLGIVSGEAALGTGMFSGFSASMSSLTGSESHVYGERISAAKNAAMRNLIKQSSLLGGNALIGIDFDYLVIDTLICVIANGTSVKIEKEAD